MNKKLPLIIAAAVIIIVIGAIVFMMSNSSSSSVTKTESPVNNEQQSQPQSAMDEKKSLKELLGMSNQTCTYSDPDSNSEGKVYVSSGKARMDFSLSLDGKVVQSHMIADGSSFYMWSDDQTQGLKMSMIDIEKPVASANQQSNVDINKRIDYKCSSWTLDATLFDLPKDIKFMDMSAMMPKMSPAGSITNSQDIKSQQCAVCDSLPVEAQAECKKSLSCN